MNKSTFELGNESIISPSLPLSPSFILPEDKRPRLSEVSTLTSIPVIDMNHEQDHSQLIRNISQACEDYGFFQITNHGVSRELCNKMMKAAAEFFDLPSHHRSHLFTTDYTKQVKIFNYYLKTEGQNKINMWSESFNHPWLPLEEFTHFFPTSQATQYPEVFCEYAKEIGLLMKRLLGLISEGLGLELDCLERVLGEDPTLKAQANFYPPCPDPDLTLGLAVHTDLNALTILRQSEGVNGLQVIKHGKWVAVNPLPDAFVVNLGDQIQVLSNGRYKSVHHRAVTNQVNPRVTLAMFYGPNKDSVIGPIEDLVDEEHPPRYRKYRYSEFLGEFYKQEGTRRMATQLFELRNI